MWTAIKARENTTHLTAEEQHNGPVPGAQVSPSYNAAASACLAVWFFFWLWAYNTFRAFRPQYFLPLIVFSIYINVTATYGCIFPTMEQAYSLTKRLLDSFFVGFGIAFAVHFVILPITTRDVVTLVLNEYLHHLRSALDAQVQLIQSLPSRRLATVTTIQRVDSDRDENTVDQTNEWPEAAKWRTATAAATECQVKIQSEMRYVKREIAWSKLNAKDFVCVSKLLRNVLISMGGIETVIQGSDRLEKMGGWASAELYKETRRDIVDQDQEEQSLSQLFLQLQQPSQQLIGAMIEGLDYAFFILGFMRKPAFATREDLESRKAASPEGRGFAGHLERAIDDFLKARERPLMEWCSTKSFDTIPGPDMPAAHRQRSRSQLYLILDLGFSIVTTARGIADLVRFADSKVEDGTMQQRRLIMPTWKTLKKWASALISREDGNLDYQTYSYRSGTPTVYLGDALGVERDPEHLSPESSWEKLTDHLRLIPKVFGSKESWFGFKVATGTMIVALSCYLRNSQHFYIEQRVIWGAIMVAISMTQTAGSGMYGQFMRVFGTFLAMIFSYIDWYMVNGHTAGVIVFVGVTMFLYHYLLVTKPDDPVIPMIGMITTILIVGYELQVKKVGVMISESNGQVFHPIYELAPYRLACVLGGVSVACLLTYFPSVTTARSEMRKDLGNTLYLLGHYYSLTHKTISLRLQRSGGDVRDKDHLLRKAEKARIKLFAKELILIQAMKNHLHFIKWEPTFGGRFPKETYEQLLNHTQNILRFTGITAYVTKTLQELPDNAHPGSGDARVSWTKDFNALLASLDLASHHVTSLLAILSSAIGSGKPLPPYLEAPERLHIGKMLTTLDSEILNTQHVCEPGYSVYAVIQVSMTMLEEDLAGLLANAKRLVGEANFDFDVVQQDYEKRVGVHALSSAGRNKED
ncbi:hypothetical protein LTS17_010411 [Exophiala oligosperma]